MCLENNKVLYCDSRGDKRFSALYAKVNLNGVIDSIENHYQNCKRDELGNIPGKGKPVSYMVYQDKKLPASKLSDFYKYLWKLYFIENPDLLEYASKFNEFIDRFKGKAINCQADVIRDLVKEGVNFNITPSMKSHIKINNKEENNMLDVNKYVIEEKLDVNSINKDECSDKIKNKFFMFENKSLKKFFYEVNEEDYSKYIEYLLSNNRKVKDSNLKFETASKYFKNKARDAIVRLFFKVPNNIEIDYTNMMSKSVAKYGDEVQYLIYDEDAYRDNDSLAELRNKNSYELYIEEDPRGQALDADLIDKISQIYTVINKAVQKRLVMLLDLEGILNNIINIIEYSSEGNVTESQYKALVNSYNSLLDKLTDEDVKEYIKEHNDIDLFASNEDTRYDYITTYQRVLRKITCNFNENLEDMKAIIHNDLDELEDTILANDTELLYEDYSYNKNDYDDTDEYTENLVLA